MLPKALTSLSHIRPENAIKDVIQAQKTQFGTLETKLITADPSPPANAWMNTKQYFWLAPKLQYDFTFNTPNEFVSEPSYFFLGFY
jgi:hypothetical protein